MPTLITSTPHEIFGAGSDGDVTISGTVTLQRDMYYSTLTVPSGTTLKPNGFKVFVRGLVVVNGTIENNGGNGANGSGTSGGSAGSAAAGPGTVGAGGAGSAGAAGGLTAGSQASAPAAVTGQGGNGGGGGAGGSASGNLGGGATSAPTVTVAKAEQCSGHLLYGTALSGAGIGGRGGSSGAGNGSGQGAGGGGGGGAGGVVAIYARRIEVGSTGKIQANGGNGGSGGTISPCLDDSGGGGGAGGGGGGVVYLLYDELTDSGGLIEAKGGTKGNGSAGCNSGTAGTNGTDGATGAVMHARRAGFVSAAAWGAVPGTTADMKTAIQAALDQAPLGSTLYFPPGTYAISGSLTCSRNINVSALGAIFDLGTTDLAPETLNETNFSSHADWDAIDGFNDTGGNAAYTHNAAGGTLTQTSANQATPAVGSARYRFEYTVSGSTGTVSAQITTAFAASAVTLDLTNGVHCVTFKAAATPGSFVISATSLSGGAFTIDDVSLKRVDAYAIRWGNASTDFNERVAHHRFEGLFVKRTRGGSSLRTNSRFIGFEWFAIQNCEIINCRAEGFEYGHYIRGSVSPSIGNSYNNFIGLRSEQCRIGLRIHAEVGGGYANENLFVRGRLAIVSSDTDEYVGRAVSIEADPPDAHVPNNNLFLGTGFETEWGRKIYCEGNQNQFIGCRYEILPPSSAKSVIRLNIVSGGTGYPDTGGKLFTESQTSGGHPATCDMHFAGEYTAEGGVIKTVTITHPGCGYTSAPTITASGGNGDEAVITADIGWVAVEFWNPGSSSDPRGSGNTLAWGYGLIALVGNDPELFEPPMEVNLAQNNQWISYTWAHLSDSSDVDCRAIRAGTETRRANSQFMGAAPEGPIRVWNLSSETSDSITVMNTAEMNKPGNIKRLRLNVRGMQVNDDSGAQLNYLERASSSDPRWVMDKGLIVNASHTDSDTRIEGDNDPNLLYVDAGTDRIGVGIAAPSTKVHVAGDITADTDVVARQLRATGDAGGTASQTTLTKTADLSSNSTGVGTILFKGTSSRNSAGFIKIYIGTTPYYVPVFDAITG